jgi:hypothetical protein
MHCGDAQFFQNHVFGQWRDRSFNGPEIHPDQRCDLHLCKVISFGTVAPLAGVCDLALGGISMLVLRQRLVVEA